MRAVLFGAGGDRSLCCYGRAEKFRGKSRWTRGGGAEPDSQQIEFSRRRPAINRGIRSSDRISRHIVIAARLEARLQQSGRFQPAVRRPAAAISASISTIKHHERAAMSFPSKHRLPSIFAGFVSLLMLGMWILAPRVPSVATAAAADQPLTNATNALAAGAEEKLTYNGSTNCQRCHREPVE